MKKSKLYFLMLSRTILFISIFYLLHLFLNKDFYEISKYWTLIVIICNLITIFFLHKFCKKNNTSYFKLTDFKKSKVITYILIGILITIVGILGTYISGFIFYKTIPYTPEVMFQPLSLFIVLFDLLIMPISSAIAEEGLYLGLGINYLKNVYFSVFIYLLQHCFFPFLFDIKYILYRFVSFIPVIIFMCFFYKKKQEIGPIMFGHFIINFITILQYFFI